MITFEDVYAVSSQICRESTFRPNEMRTYYDVLVTLPKRSLIVEIGLRYGRSSSIALQVAVAHDLQYMGIDPFEDYATWSDAETKWNAVANSILNGHKKQVTVQKCRSQEADVPKEIHAILIDGDHTYEAAFHDATKFLPYVVPGGYAMFHDFGDVKFPGIFNAVADYMAAHPEFDYQSTTRTLGVWKRK